MRLGGDALVARGLTCCASPVCVEGADCTRHFSASINNLKDEGLPTMSRMWEGGLVLRPQEQMDCSQRRTASKSIYIEAIER